MKAVGIMVIDYHNDFGVRQWGLLCGMMGIVTDNDVDCGVENVVWSDGNCSVEIVVWSDGDCVDIVVWSDGESVIVV